MKKYIKIGILVLIALIFIGTFVFLYQKSQPKDTKYDIQKVETTNLVQTTVATGKIEPRDEVQIKPQISGIIAEVYKEAGEKVKKGEVIAKVKVIPELGQLNSAESRVRLAEMNGRQAETDLTRMEKLYNDKLVSNEEYEKTLLAARKNLRRKFIEAEAAMTGANFAVASTGECVVCTNEGNADMGTSQPKLQITAFGMEKIVPDRDALGVFTRLLARSGTGQPITTYTSHYRKPRKGGELHIIIVDNGRSRILADQEHVKALNCLRCGACMNTCPVYRRSGGYSYTYFIPGPIGINLGMLKAPLHYYDNVSACSLCYSCQNVCPAKVDLADQIYHWRQQLHTLGVASSSKKLMSGGMKFLMSRPALFNFALKNAPIVNSLPRGMIYNDLNDWGKEREIPEFAKESFNEMWKKNKVK